MTDPFTRKVPTLAEQTAQTARDVDEVRMHPERYFRSDTRSCPECGTGEWDFTGPCTAECANGHQWDEGPAIPGTLVRPGHPGDVNDPERYPDDDDDGEETS